MPTTISRSLGIRLIKVDVCQLVRWHSGFVICQLPVRPPVPVRPRLKTTNYPNLQSVTEARTIFHPTSNFFSLLKNAHRVALAKDSQLIYNGKIE